MVRASRPFPIAPADRTFAYTYEAAEVPTQGRLILRDDDADEEVWASPWTPMKATDTRPGRQTVTFSLPRAQVRAWKQRRRLGGGDVLELWGRFSDGQEMELHGLSLR